MKKQIKMTFIKSVHYFKKESKTAKKYSKNKLENATHITKIQK